MRDVGDENKVAILFEEIGRDAVRARIFGPACGSKVPGEKSISQVIWARKIPASWYAVIKEMADEKGVTCSLSLFNFKPGVRPACKAREAAG